ncbi:MAG: NAD(P)H-binding protein [Candidatus Loosdrechtia sp.]|uniref:NAD(P)H-binding protein n=1 Tax=Candidatus Loosdrechtia sp. TaxID=3101272 RepID=UPI003A6BE39E|nr:MAG: NAD(P)H-binding protein [Candidatus Jettenia sp. AMX2]
MKNTEDKPDNRILVIGATGFIGGRLVSELIKKNMKLKLLVRNPSKLSPALLKHELIEVVKGDILKNEGLHEAVQAVHSAFYLVHSMGGKSIFSNKEFAKMDKLAARNFVAAADAAGVKRVIYLGGLGETGKNLSEHLQSRAEIAEILSSGNMQATVLRAAVIIGAGGASYEMLRYLVERLPVMVCPKWINTKIQPIAVGDVIAYLTGCLLNPETAGKTFDIGGPDIMTYREMMQRYAEVKGLYRRLIFSVPVLTPRLAAYWVDLVTPVPSGIAHPLIEGLKNEVICHESSIDRYVHIRKTTFSEAVRIALEEAAKMKEAALP